MKIVMQRRAEIAFRSLGQSEQKQVSSVLNKVSSVAPQELQQHSNFRRVSTSSGENLYMHQECNLFSLVLSTQEGKCFIEDVIAHDRLN